MERLKKKQAGITLIALVISIIVMLILAGVSINATIGENGIVTKAQLATVTSRIAHLKEELELNIVGAMTDDGIEQRAQVTVLNDSIRAYLPSIEDDEIGKYGVIAGELYYIGEDKLYKTASESQGVKVKADGVTIDDFRKEVEGLAIENIVKNMGGEAFSKVDDDGNSTEIGVKLKNKQLGINDWKIIIDVQNGETKATYGTGWTYVEAGNTVEGLGTLQSSYIIDFTNRKAVQFDARKHSMLTYGSDLSVTDSILFSADPSVIEEGYKGDVSWLNNVNGYGFANNYAGSFTKNSMIFNGLQYISVPGNLSDVATSGITFEFFGKFYDKSYNLINWETKTYYDSETETRKHYTSAQDFIENHNKTYNATYPFVPNTTINIGDGANYVLCDTGKTYGWSENFCSGLLCTSKTVPVGQRIFRMWSAGNADDENAATISFNYGSASPNTLNDWTRAVIMNYEGTNDTWNMDCRGVDNNFVWKANENVYFTITFDPVNDIQTVYVNGIKQGSTNMNITGWNAAMGAEQYKGDGYFNLGQATQGEQDWFMMFAGEVNAMRLYSRVLNENEVKANYNATTSYYNIISGNGNAETGGETGGEDF